MGRRIAGFSIFFARSPSWYAQRAASSRRGAEFLVSEIERHVRIVAPPDTYTGLMQVRIVSLRADGMGVLL